MHLLQLLRSAVPIRYLFAYIPILQARPVCPSGAEPYQHAGQYAQTVPAITCFAVAPVTSVLQLCLLAQLGGFAFAHASIT